MKLIQLFEPHLIREALREDDLYKSILHIDSIDTWIPDTCICKWFVGFKDNEFLGVLLIDQKTDYLYGFHGGVYKPYRGQGTEIVKEALEIVREQYHCKFMTTIPSNNTPAQGLVLRLGLTEIGRIKDGYKPFDMIIYSEEE